MLLDQRATKTRGLWSERNADSTISESKNGRTFLEQLYVTHLLYKPVEEKRARAKAESWEYAFEDLSFLLFWAK